MCVCLHRVVLRLASYAADGGPRKAIFYDRTKCANVLNVSNAVKIFCPTVEYCENCVSYLDFTAADRGRNASDRFVRRGDKVLDQIFCFQVYGTYTSDDGVVFANVTFPEFNKTSSALYCRVFYDIAKRQGIVGVPLLKYGERSSEPSTMPPGDDKKNSSSAAVSLLPFSVSFLLSALSLLTQIWPFHFQSCCVLCLYWRWSESLTWGFSGSLRHPTNSTRQAWWALNFCFKLF